MLKREKNLFFKSKDIKRTDSRLKFNECVVILKNRTWKNV